MKTILPLLTFWLLLCPVAPLAADASNIDPSEKNDELSPNAKTADTPLSPGREVNQRPIERNDTVQDQRFRAPEMIERKNAPIADKRAPIEVEDAREKTIIERKDAPKPELKDRVINRHNGQKSAIQPSGDDIKKFDTNNRFENHINDAKNAASQRQPKIEKRTTFDKINRFIFKRNGPGTEGNPGVTTAGGGSTPSSSQDSRTKYPIDWSQGRTTPE